MDAQRGGHGASEGRGGGGEAGRANVCRLLSRDICVGNRGRQDVLWKMGWWPCY